MFMWFYSYPISYSSKNKMKIEKAFKFSLQQTESLIHSKRKIKIQYLRFPEKLKEKRVNSYLPAKFEEVKDDSSEAIYMYELLALH